MRRAYIAFVVALLAFGCGKDRAKTGNPVPSPQQEPPAVPQQVAPAPAPVTPPAPAVDPRPVVEVRISVTGSTMAFSVTRFSAAAGQRVHVVLENKGPGSLPHNWALVMPGTEAAVAAAGLAKGQEAGFIAPGPDLLAHTDMVMPGKTAEVTFAAPAAPGSYPYICTFPGHYMMMKGVLEVKP